jgi:hypothetical protein
MDSWICNPYRSHHHAHDGEELTLADAVAAARFKSKRINTWPAEILKLFLEAGAQISAMLSPVARPCVTTLASVSDPTDLLQLAREIRVR